MANIEVHKYRMVFGWEGDNGLGERLIQKVINGEKTATCAPKDEYSEQELKECYEPVGEMMTVFDKDNNARCNIRLLEVFETTFGNPDLKLVRGEGYGDQVTQFQEDHRRAWRDTGIDLQDDTILIVERFEIVDES